MDSERRGRKILLDGGKALENLDPYGNPLAEKPVNERENTSEGADDLQTEASKVKKKEKVPLAKGIVTNMHWDIKRQGFFRRWFRSLCKGYPFPIHQRITLFQVFPENTQTSATFSPGNCEQVIIYGEVSIGVISDNNIVEIYGMRDSDNQIIANEVKNLTTGTKIRPNGVMSVVTVWIITVVLFIIGVISGLSV